MSRATDYPGSPDEATRSDLADLFAYLFPGNPDGEINHAHSGLAVAAQSPKLALHLAQMSRFIALDLPWCERADLRELVIRAVNTHYGSRFSNDARLPQAAAAGLSEAQVAAIPDAMQGAHSPLFDAQQALVLDYARAVLTGAVDDALFARMVAQFGERGTVECTSAIGWWALWAMLIEATGAGRGPAA